MPVHSPPVSRHFGRASGSRRSEEHTSELQSQSNLVCRLLLEKKKKKPYYPSPPHTTPPRARSRRNYSRTDRRNRAPTIDTQSVLNRPTARRVDYTRRDRTLGS